MIREIVEARRGGSGFWVLTAPDRDEALTKAANLSVLDAMMPAMRGLECLFPHDVILTPKKPWATLDPRSKGASYAAQWPVQS